MVDGKQWWDSILQEAISGKLVPQLDSEPAVEQIGPAPAADEVPFEIPEKWKWVELGSIAAKVSDGSHNPPPKVAEGVPVLSAKDIQDDGSLSFSTAARRAVESDCLAELKRNPITVGDVLLSIVGSIGKVAVIEHESKFILQRSVAIIKLETHIGFTGKFRET